MTSDLAMAILRSSDWTCTHCRKSADQVDHVRPVHAGGLAIPVNLASLCGDCNLIKSCYWPGHGYHPFRDHDDAEHARLILWSELDWLAEHHGGHSSVADELWGGAGEPGPWSWREPADGPWLATWC
jgi:hypothetical protein